MNSLSPTDPALTRARELLMKHLPSAPTLWLKPPGDTPPHHPESRFYQPWYPEHKRLLASGWKSVERTKAWPQVVLFGGRYKEENRRLLEAGRSLLSAEGKLYFVLPNEYGAKSFLKGLNGLQEHLGRKSRLLVLSAGAETPIPLETLERNDEGLTSSPGLFSWEAADAGSKLLADVLEEISLRGPVADLGAGWGYLGYRLWGNLELHLLEADRRGLLAARENLSERRAHFHWCDVTDTATLPRELLGRIPTVITNPPFHTSKKADPVLGGAFVATAHALLNARGTFYMVGNQHLPYPKILEAYFPNVEVLRRQAGYTILKGSK